MDDKQRALVYAFLSRMFANVLDKKLLLELRQDDNILEMILAERKEWFLNTPFEELEETLNVDFSSLFLMNSMPIESSIMDDKEEVLVGLQNPVMQFYFEHGYELNLQHSSIQAPDHLSIECAFMQNLILKQEVDAQRAFLQEHLLMWAPMYLLGLYSMAQTPFYQALCEFSVEFFLADYETLMGMHG
ncbi:MAG: molecular chaperone TorD family protein [Sulfurospirillaceae bacterium]|nr:molecular chaperone TorD family protein [Sulfurospirillaceae bacterium]